jgi:D-alanine-D-alanine ligase
MRVAFIYNIATEELLRERPEATLRDCDSLETIRHVTAALEAGGHTVIGFNADQRLPAILVESKSEFDIVFNIATGVYGESRQTHVPAMCEYLRIPHTGSGVLAEAICHHKPQTKMILMAHGVPTAPFQVFKSADEPLKPNLRFPLIVKLTSEGASMGLDYDSVVHNEADLRDRVARLISTYQQNAMVEEYIDGREFTVAVLGNNPAYALPVGEMHFYGKLPIRLDEPDPEHFEMLKVITGQHEMKAIPVESETLAPADIPPDVADRIQKMAIAAYQAIGCLDWARVDLRMDKAGNLYVLEVNLEPGVAPGYAFSKMGFAAGWTYTELINRILNHAIERYPHLTGDTALMVSKPGHEVLSSR